MKKFILLSLIATITFRLVHSQITTLLKTNEPVTIRLGNENTIAKTRNSFIPKPGSYMESTPVINCKR